MSSISQKSLYLPFNYLRCFLFYASITTNGNHLEENTYMYTMYIVNMLNLLHALRICYMDSTSYMDITSQSTIPRTLLKLSFTVA